MDRMPRLHDEEIHRIPEQRFFVKHVPDFHGQEG
jgi:hypothetical protein